MSCSHALSLQALFPPGASTTAAALRKQLVYNATLARLIPSAVHLEGEARC